MRSTESGEVGRWGERWDVDLNFPNRWQPQHSEEKRMSDVVVLIRKLDLVRAVAYLPERLKPNWERVGGLAFAEDVEKLGVFAWLHDRRRAIDDMKVREQVQ